jgi:hypothetical protein
LSTTTTTTTTTTTPQQITWFYVNDLTHGANFLLETLQLNEVKHLIQIDKCRIFHSTEAPASFLGVCNTRSPPQCTSGSQGNAVATTYTFVASSEESVDNLHQYLLPLNSTKLLLTNSSGSPNIWGAYGFNFYDINFETGLGCYRFEVQYFTDSNWALDTHVGLLEQLERAGDMLYNETIPAKPVDCLCEDFCSGYCFAPSCAPCAPSVWNNDESSCLNAGPLGHGLLCSRPLAKENPCCQPNGTTCSLAGGEWCDCSKYSKKTPLFPPLSDSGKRTFRNGTCLQH